jgi:hypothetical protein
VRFIWGGGPPLRALRALLREGPIWTSWVPWGIQELDSGAIVEDKSDDRHKNSSADPGRSSYCLEPPSATRYFLGLSFNSMKYSSHLGISWDSKGSLLRASSSVYTVQLNGPHDYSLVTLLFYLELGAGVDHRPRQ